jgi:transposase
MAAERTITMSQKELKRASVLEKVLARGLTQEAAGEMLGICDRQVRRLIKRFKERGAKGIIHRSRGKPSNRATGDKAKERIIKIYRSSYWDFGPTLASEKLFERDNIKISDETLRNWLLKSGDWKKRRNCRKHRKWRERKHNYGEMLQGDGSHHDWFEGRGPRCVMIAFIDDATGKAYARFYEYEGTKPVMDCFKRYIRQKGIPHSIYMDNHSTYKTQEKPSIEDELKGIEPLSQFERAVKELEIRFMHAGSPQAKGRVERLFKTMQDRLIKEMRLSGVNSIKAGNEFLKKYLPEYNERFGVMAAGTTNMHRAIPGDMDLDSILCIKEKRVVRNDFTVSYEKRLYQILNRTIAKKVTIEERISGRIVISYAGEELSHKEIVTRPERVIEKRPYMSANKYRKPPKRHPWGRWIERGYPQNPSYQQKEKVGQKEKELLLV